MQQVRHEHSYGARRAHAMRNCRPPARNSGGGTGSFKPPASPENNNNYNDAEACMRGHVQAGVILRHPDAPAADKRGEGGGATEMTRDAISWNQMPTRPSCERMRQQRTTAHSAPCELGRVRRAPPERSRLPNAPGVPSEGRAYLLIGRGGILPALADALVGLRPRSWPRACCAHSSGRGATRQA
eukprot:CAMPEP_0170260740 /NCGR_PEP_ID=MMETSP0116_2-20130129/30248_1 /TAXON_ID=400756 /ORGANISM="Durinskia baltica, Strain CSIRO CS-38" /LENGTH=184 /DNA_ID=CAMNT_0010511799 /DNA_START=72 /DNA_END=621 /DNA_ORIENTATION=+